MLPVSALDISFPVIISMLMSPDIGSGWSARVFLGSLGSYMFRYRSLGSFCVAAVEGNSNLLICAVRGFPKVRAWVATLLEKNYGCNSQTTSKRHLANL